MSNPPPSMLDRMTAFMAQSETQDIKSIERTMELRWNNGELEQKYLITTWRNSKAIDQEHEWRPIPEASA